MASNVDQPPLTADVVGALALTVLLIAGGIFIGDASIGWGVGLLVFLLLLYVMSRVPVRYSLMGLMFCAYTLENPSEPSASGLYYSPVSIVGSLMLQHMKNQIGAPPIFLSGMDLLLVSLLLIALSRRSGGSSLEGINQIPTPRPLVKLAYVSLGATTYTWLVGMVRGGDFSISLWQLDRVVYVPLVFLLFHFGLRGIQDAMMIAKTAILGALVKAFFAVYVTMTVPVPPDDWGIPQVIPCPTSHSTSILFACAFTLIVATLVERAGRHRYAWAALLLPLLAVGMSYNNRRMVWVEVALVFLTLYLVTPQNPVKRKIKKAVIILSPLIVIYVRVGWYSKAPVFKPAQTVRSIVDPDYDPSTMTREIENYNLTYTIKRFPILGMGYGNGYWMMIPLPEMGYPLEPYCPHNSILGLWVFCGYFGYVGTTLLWVGGVFFGFRAYHASKAPKEKVASLMCFGSILIYMIQCWGDMGLGTWIGVFTVAPASAMAGKLAVASGAWLPKQPKRILVEAPAFVVEPVAAGSHTADQGRAG